MIVEDLFIKLVKIASPSGFEQEVARFVQNELEINKVDTVFDQTGNLLCRSGGEGEPVLISAHLDTVQGDSKIKPFIKNGVLRSSGNTILGADNKATIAAILSALKNTPLEKRKNLELIFSVREETDGGISNVDVSWLKSKSGISADSSEPIGSIISETPYIEIFEIEVVGKSSHSSEPEIGINALSIASDAISKFTWGSVDDISTANIGIIEGGSAINVTPGRIFLRGELRSAEQRRLQEMKQNLETVFISSAKKFKGVIKIKYNYICDGYKFNDQEMSLKNIIGIYKKMNVKKSMMKSFGASDANFFNAKGIKVVDIGDGVDNPHSDDEHIKVKDLHSLTEIFTNYIKA